MSTDKTRRRPAWSPALVLLAALPATAQETATSAATAEAAAAGVVRAWTVTPRIGVTESYTDNVSADSARRQSDFVTQVSPGVRIAGKSARARLDLDYSLSEMAYSRDSTRNQRQNYLNAFGSVEAVEDWLFFEFSSLVGQQNISAFGTQSASDLTINSNRTETSNFRLSPYIRGRLGGFAAYDARYSRSTTRSKSDLAIDSEVEQWTGHLGGDTGLAKLRWAVDGSWTRNRIVGGRDSNNDHVDVLLSYALDHDLSIGFTAGHGSDTLETTGKRAGSTRGYRVDWTPTERTALNISGDKRTYGNTYSVAFNHRTPLSAWRFSDTRDVTILPNQLVLGSRGSIYDLMYAQLASAFPDPAARAQQVNDILRQTGIAANSPVTTGFFTTRPSVQRRQDMSLVLNGVRNTVTYTLMQSTQDALGGGSVDDFSNSPKIRQRGFTSNWSYRLTALASLGVYSSRLDTLGNGAAGQDSRKNTLNLSVTAKVGARTTASLAAGHSTFKSAAASTDENLMSGTVTHEF